VASTAAVVITGYDNYAAWLLIFSVIAIIYSAVGGAWAVAIMDSFQFIVTLIGALIVFPVAMRLAGYIPGLVHWLGAHGKASHMQFVPSGTSEFNWLFVLGMVLLSIKWACVDQAILQRAFGAKDPKTVAKGMVFAGLITTPFAFLWILPGIATNVLPGHLLAQIDNPDKAMPIFLASQLPLVFRGLLGIVLCGLVASQMSVITSDINSVATLFTSDVFRHMTKKELTQRQLLMLVRCSAIVTGVLMLLVAWFMQYTGDGAVRMNLTVVGIVDMPLFVITVIFGLLWKRTTWQGALVGFFAGGIVGCVSYFHIPPEIVKSVVPFVSSGTALIVTPIVSLLTKPTSKEKLAHIAKAFVVTKEETDDSVGFHLVPRSAAGKAGIVLMLAGYAGFLGGVLSANWQFPMAAAVAIASMVVFFIGGVTRVHAD
jgi:SSS family solute:Na+ symporter